MAFVIKDRVFEYTTTTGTGTLTLGGTKSGYQQFATVGDGNTTYYTIVAENGDWESGIGTYTSSGTTLARTTVLASSNSNNLVNFAAGIKEVFSSQPAGRAVAIDTLATSTSLGTSNLLAPSQNAVKGYVDNRVYPTDRRNLLHNPTFLINIRNPGDLYVTTSITHPADRWAIQASANSIFSSQAVLDLPLTANGSISYLKNTARTISGSPAAGYYATIIQSIEGYFFNRALFGTADAKNLILSFKAKCSRVGTYSIAITNGDSTISYVSDYTITTANAWQDFVISIPGCTTGTWSRNNATAAKLKFSLGSGTTYKIATKDTWVSGNYLQSSTATGLCTHGSVNDTLMLTEVQLEVGTFETPFEQLTNLMYLLDCQRYFEALSFFSQNATGYGGGCLSFRVIKRAVPTVAFVNTSGIAAASLAFTTTTVDGVGWNHNTGYASGTIYAYADLF